MAPKKRKVHAQAAAKHAQAAAKPARVRCPACQKEVPSFFVNSHLDLECQVLKWSPMPSRPSLVPISAQPSAILGPGTKGNAANRETISNSSAGHHHTLVTSLFDEGRREELRKHETDEYIMKRVAEHKQCEFLDEENVRGDCVHDVQSGCEMPTNHLCMASFRNSEPSTSGREDLGSGKSLVGSTGILSPYSSSQFVHWRKCGGEAASVWVDRGNHLATISHSFPSLPMLKLKAPKGLQVLENFISIEKAMACCHSLSSKCAGDKEEEHLLHCLDTDVRNPWKLSRVNGIHQGKSYGNHIFGDSVRRVVSQLNDPMPNFVLPYVERMQTEVPVLKDFLPNEMNSIDYRKGDGHYLKAHMDDRQLVVFEERNSHPSEWDLCQLSGTVLVNLSLTGGCFMTYTKERGLKEAFRVKLSPRSLQVLTGESRYNYTHGIQKNDILDPRRVSMTFRQSVESLQTVRPSR